MARRPRPFTLGIEDGEESFPDRPLDADEDRDLVRALLGGRPSDEDVRAYVQGYNLRAVPR